MSAAQHYRELEFEFRTLRESVKLAAEDLHDSPLSLEADLHIRTLAQDAYYKVTALAGYAHLAAEYAEGVEAAANARDQIRIAP